MVAIKAVAHFRIRVIKRVLGTYRYYLTRAGRAAINDEPAPRLR
jgi:hypothetical protein